MSEKYATQLLDTWLSFATDGFSDGARARISEEVKCQVAEAVERLQQEALSSEDAFHQTFKEFGDPAIAHDTFKQILADTPGLTSLYSWLSVATRGLCDEAKARITAEIKAHVREGVGHFKQEEVPEDTALLKAIAELGNPSKARRAFKRIHLTVPQARYIERLATTHLQTVEHLKKHRRWVLPLLAIFTAVAIILPLALVPAFELKYGPSTLGLLIIMATHWGNIIINRRKRRIQQLLIINVLGYGPFHYIGLSLWMIGTMWEFWLAHHELFFILTGSMCFYILYDAMNRMWLLKKLRHGATNQPPQDAQ